MPPPDLHGAFFYESWMFDLRTARICCRLVTLDRRRLAFFSQSHGSSKPKNPAVCVSMLIFMFAWLFRCILHFTLLLVH